MSELVLHHYDFSNYSEKVRVALGYKGLSWKSVIVPPVLPKVDLVALTGGYRRAPVLQIGADIYCDTALILRELDRRFPDRPLHPRSCAGLAKMISAWAESTFFRSVMLLAWGTNHDVMPQELFEDRARMRGLPTPTQRSVERAAARNAPLVRAQLPLIEDLFSDGRLWVCGSEFSIADLSIYHAIWFLTDRSDRLAGELIGYRKLRKWRDAVAEFGHGRREEISAAEALTIAWNAEPAAPRENVRHPEDPQLGDAVEIRASDYGKDAIAGRLELLDVDEVAIRTSAGSGGQVVVHFPRMGFDLRSAH